MSLNVKVIIFLLLFFVLGSKMTYAKEWAISSYPLFKIMQEIFKEESLYLIQPPRGEFHFAELSPKEWQRLKGAELVFVVGTEPWASRLIKTLPNEKVLSLLETNEKPVDPHLWFDLERLERKLKTLVELPQVKAKPLYATYYKRSEEFLQRVRTLREAYGTLKKCPQRELYIIGHSVFYYLFKDLSIQERPLIRGHHHGEISAKKLKEVIQLAKERKIKALLLTEREFIKYKKTFEKEGLEILEAWSGDYDRPGDLVTLLEDNLKVFKKALNCP
ncbi:MAG: metal ABC transporter substrate-binding protein [Caldimicrobium sp.]|nr:metal ABC transporter substrate-binding protein [Caldimicrobium sp.]MCX7874144.1 metal ABC transporter substrate-binding protein [Caldimicrobium sp.]MDW8093721.1 metal ABC transporter substrate-binding protein [Caldimicrobium sp.]